MVMRDEFTTVIKEMLAKRVNYRCSNPQCRQPTSGPHIHPAKTINVGVAAHLTAASPGGPRFNAALSVEQRKSAENGIWLCQKCAKLVDNDSVRYALKVLQNWKREAETTAILELEGNAANELNPTGTSSFRIPIPNLFGLDYDDARARLIEAGWQPCMNHWSYADNMDIRYGNGPVFWQKGYHEIESSSGTGYAICSFKFVDVYGNTLKVITGGEEYPDEDIKASVMRWFFESTSRSADLSWPENQGVYIATSSATIPPFPSALVGYRDGGDKDYWGRPFSTKGSIRIFEGNDWEPIPDFPLTMNHCSDGVFMIRWRSANPDVLIATAIGYHYSGVIYDTQAGTFGYMQGTNCEEPMFKFAGAHNETTANLVDIYYELKFWQAAP
jgi:hypothetical protein